MGDKKDKPASAQDKDKEADNKKKEKDSMDMSRARKIVLDTIGEEEKPKEEKINIKITSGGFRKRGKISDSSRWADKENIQKKKKSFMSFTMGPKEVEDTHASDGGREEEKKDIDSENIKENQIKEKVEEISQPTAEEEEKKEVNIKPTVKPSKKIVKKSSKKKAVKKIKVVEFRKSKEKPKMEKEGKLREPIRRIIFVVINIVLAVLIVYISFALFLYNFAPDNSFTRKINYYLNVPALISKSGMIEYYNYKDALKINNYSGDTKIYLIKTLIIIDLSKKYNLNITLPRHEELNNRIILDKTINRKPLEKIKKIELLLIEGKDFDEISKEYSDEINVGKNIDHDNIVKTFGESVALLSVGEISDRIIAPNGFYIAKILDKDADLYSVKYIFVRAKNLDDYLEEKINSMKIWSFVD